MNLAAYYAEWKTLIASGMDMSWWQEFFVKFYQAFIEADRWKQYLDGVGTTLMATALALVLGVVLGVLVAMIRTPHHQQRPGVRNPFLGLFNFIAKVYVTVIRVIRLMVQMLMWSSVVILSTGWATICYDT